MTDLNVIGSKMTHHVIAFLSRFTRVKQEMRHCFPKCTNCPASKIFVVYTLDFSCKLVLSQFVNIVFLDILIKNRR